MGAHMNTYRALLEEAEEKRPLGRQRRRWEDTIKIGLIKKRIKLD
jgi:hypothetical protein